MILGKKFTLVLAIICAHTVTRLESRPLNILFVVAYFPAPSQTYILNMMTRLIDKGHKVSIFAFRNKENDKNIPEHPDIEKYSLKDSVIYEEFPEELPDCDIVFCQSGTLGRQIVSMERLQDWLKKRKLVVCLRGGDTTSNYVREDPGIYEKLFKEAHLFLPVCEYFKKLIVEYGCDADKVTVHHSTINCSQFYFKERKNKHKKRKTIRLVSVSRLVEKKGLNFALEAIAEIVKKYKNIHFTIVGNGHWQRRLEKMTKNLGIASKVTFFGWGTQDQVAHILNKSHIFLSPSVQSARGEEEGIANSLKEAMATGLISIGTFHAGTPELIEDGISGFLVHERNSKELAQKIKYIIEHPEIWRSIGLAARKKVEDEFEIKKSVEKLEKIFYQLVSSK